MGCATLTKIFAGTLDVEAINIEKESYTIIETSTIVDAIKDNAFREFLIETYANGVLRRRKLIGLRIWSLMPTMRRK